MYSTFKVIYDAQSVSVNPVTTTVVPSNETGPSDTYSGQVKNTDGSQTLDCYIQTSWDGTNWGTSEWAGLTGIAAGETRQFSVATGKARFIRIIGTASGAGLTASVSVELSYESGTRGGPR